MIKMITRQQIKNKTKNKDKDTNIKAQIQIKEADKAAMLEVINTNESDSAHKDFLPRQNKISFHEKNYLILKENKN